MSENTAPQTETQTSTPAERPVYLGMFGKQPDQTDSSPVELALAIGSVFWVLIAGQLFWLLPFEAGTGSTTLTVAVAVIAVFVPLGLAWIAILSVRSARQVHAETNRLQNAINAMRHAFVQQQQSGTIDITPGFERKLEEIAAAQRSTDAKLARFTSIRPDLEKASAEERSALGATQAPVSATAAPDQDVQPQASLALGTPAEMMGPPLSVADFIKAMNFPDDPDDKDGFRALRRALQDRNASQLVQAAEDVLTLLSQDGIYMDDLQPDRARPEIWRRFAKGERGKSIAILGGIRDRSSLALSAGRMRQDTIFRDSVHHFLRKFDHTFSEFEKTASDLEIAALTDTRSARAFMLLGRVTGTFD